MAIDVDAPRQRLAPSPDPQRRSLLFIAVALVGLIVGSAVTWWIVRPRATDLFPVQILQGNAYFNKRHTAFALTLQDGSQLFDDVGDAEGRECIPPPDLTTADNIFMDIRIGVVGAAPIADKPGRYFVVWIECLGPPTRP